MRTAFALLSLFLLCAAQSGQKQYSVPYGGADIISNTDLFSSQVSFCSNLAWNNGSTEIWFTADDSSPNLRYAEFDPANPVNHSFWLWTKSPVDKDKAAPFVSLAISGPGDTLSGGAFPTLQTQNYQGLVLQTVYKNGFVSTSSVFPGYEFFGITYGKQTQGGIFVYVAGWVNFDNSTTHIGGFVVARGILRTTGGGIFIDETKDITPPLLPTGCYDIYTEVQKPQMYVIDNYLIVIMPGRCRTILRFTQPSEDSFPFKTLRPEILTPGGTQYGIDYIAASAFDPASGNLYFVTRQYNKPNATLNFVLGKSQPLRVAATGLLATGESAVQLAAGFENGKDNVFVIAPDLGVIFQIFADASKQTFDFGYYANLPPPLIKASSFLYINHFIYMSTYEPACKLARIPIQNFCPYFCGANAWCSAGICKCLPNYAPLWDSNNRFNGCQLEEIHEEQLKEKQIVGTAAVMGVLFVLTAFIAFFGWRAWWAGKQSPQAQALVHEYNRPL